MATVAGRNGASRGAASGYYADGRQYGKRAVAGEPPFARLFESMRTSGKKMERHRRERFEAVKDFVGTHYSDEGKEVPVPVNLIARYVQVMGKYLVPGLPRGMVSPRKRGMAPAVFGMQEWLNRHLKKTYFEETVAEWVTNAFFGTSILKVSLATPADAASGGYAQAAGEPCVEPIDPEDFRFDPGTRKIKKAAWTAHRYRIAVDLARKLDDFDSKERKLIVSDSPSSVAFTEHGDDHIARIGGSGSHGDMIDYRDMTYLWEVYVPELKRVYTFRSSAGGGVPPAEARPLRVQPWVGPACGPFHELTFVPVVGNPWGKGILLDLVPLSRTINDAYSKLMEQLLAQKTVYGAQTAGIDDAHKIKNASDGEIITIEMNQPLEEFKYGGPDQKCAAFGVHLTDVFNQQAGNLAVLAGSNTQAKTATQEQMLQASANTGVADMQGKVNAALSRVYDALCWYWWYHPEKVMTTTRTPPGLPEFAREVSVYPAGHPKPDAVRREGSYEELDCRIDPHSMVFRSPAQRLQGLLGVVDKFIPLTPVLAQQNIRMDLQYVVKKVGEYMDEPDIEQMFTVAPTPEGPPKPGGDGGGIPKPSSTERNYTRTSVGQDTEANRYAEMANAAGGEDEE